MTTSDGSPPRAPAPEDGVAQLCAELIRFDTTNYGGGESRGEREAAEYLADHLRALDLNPVVLESAPRRTNVVVRIPGTDPDAAAMLVHAHLDVVPADASDWTTDPFSGAIRDGCVWGRGAVDMKNMIAMVVSAVRSWPGRGIRPRRDIVLAFVADEEDHGEYGAVWLVRNHPELFEGCTFAIGESGGSPMRVGDTRLYPVATAERGTVHLRLTARGRAGHGSRPNPDNAVTKLVTTLHRINTFRWPVRLTPTVRAYLEGTAAALGVEADLESDAGVDATIERLGPAGALAAATVRNSSTPTVLEAGYKVNVIPSVATADLDTRCLPGTEEELLATIDDLLEPGVERHIRTHTQAVHAPVDSPWFAAMADALRAEDPDAIVVPCCLGGGTDAKAFSELGIAGYGFSPVFAPADFNLRGMAHAVDERVPVPGIEAGARVLDRFLTTC